MKKRIIMGIMAMTVLMTFTGCRQIPPAPVETPPELMMVPDVLSDEEEKELMGEVDTYHDNDTDVGRCLPNAAFKLLGELEPNEDGNLLISPYSIDSAVGMTEFGADGQTLREMELTVNGNVDTYMMAEYLNVIKEKMDSQDDVKWNVANSVWMNDRDDVTLDQRFEQYVNSFYGAKIEILPFDDVALTRINGWVNEETNGMIPDIIDNIRPEAISYLINAVAFEGKWENEYEDRKVYEDCDFHNADGSISKITGLYSNEEESFEYEGSLAFARPYAGGNYYFVGLVPGDNGKHEDKLTVEEYVDKIANSEESFADAFLHRDLFSEVNVMIPEFEMDYESSLVEAYTNMGMTTPFNENEADFKGMFDRDGNPHNFWIGDIIHKTHIEVDREGTKAAAATAVVVYETAAAPMDNYEVYLDEPFVYAIVDGDTGMPLFVGYINNM